MTLPAHILERLPQQLRRNSLIQSASSLLPAGSESEDFGERLRRGELLGGGIVEFVQTGRGAFGTSLSLLACREAQRQGREAAFLDPSRSLHAPGVAALGVDLERLVVVEPTPESLGRVATRLAESRLFSVLVIDTVGVASNDEAWSQNWVRVVRRLALALEHTQNSIVLLSSAEQQVGLPLAVKERVELIRSSPGELSVRLIKDQFGRISGARRLSLRPLSRGPGAGSDRHVA
jgi:recombination protein RecA